MRTAEGASENRSLITREQLLARHYSTAYDAVHSIRGNWLIARGRESLNRSVEIQVYQDGVRMGGLAALRNISTETVQYIRFYSGIEATTHWGLDHGRGAIFVVTEGSLPGAFVPPAEILPLVGMPRAAPSTAGTIPDTVSKGAFQMSLSRRQFLTSSSLAVVASTLDWRALLAQGAPPLQPDALVPVRGSIGTFTGQGGTIGWHIDAKSVAVVDSQFPASAKTCLDAVNARTSSRPLDFLVNTHHHGDHTGGNPVFRPVARKILAQANVPRLQMEAAARAAQAAPPGAPPRPEQVVADTTFEQTWREKVGDETMALRHYGPAHTGGDAVVTFEKADVAHVGDLVFNRRHPVIDRPGGASIANWISSLEGIVGDHGRGTIYIFGHAATSFPATGNRADLLYMRDYLTALLDFVRGEMKAGKPKEVIVKITDPLKGFPDHGPLIERVLTAAYDELA